MMENWLTAAEQILFYCNARKKKVIAFVSPGSESGVTTCAMTAAGVAALSGYRTLLINLSKPVQPHARAQTWVHTTASPLAETVKGAAPFDLLVLNATEIERFHFNNMTWFSNILQQEVERYDYVFLDLPAILDKRDATINPISVMGSCDCVLMVCEPGGVTRSSVQSALDQLESAGRTIDGVVMNNGKRQSTRDQIIDAARRAFRFLPGVSAMIERRAQKSRLLD